MSRNEQVDLVIVVDRLLTGFDAPCMSAIFIDSSFSFRDIAGISTGVCAAILTADNAFLKAGSISSQSANKASLVIMS